MSNERATENAGFLDGRDYTAAFLYEFFALLVGNGVYTNELAPTATNENMTITHGAGHAWINGVCYKNTTPFPLDIAMADGALNRYDSLMLRLDLSANEAYALIVQGAYATNPTPPACVRNAETHDLKICDIYVPAGCTKITQAQITDRRLDASVCGVPVFPVQHMDMTTFYRQIVDDLANFRQRSETDFSAWVHEQEESHLATMTELVEVVRRTSDNSVAEILDLLQTLNEMVDDDAVGRIMAEISKIRQTMQDLPADGSVTEVKIAEGAVTEGKIADQSVTPDKLDRAYATLTDGKVTPDQAASSIVFQSENLTISEAHAGKFIRCGTANITITIPEDLPWGMEFEVCRYHDNTVTFAPGAGVTIVSVDSMMSIASRYGVAVAKQIGTNMWLLSGGLG